MATVETRFTATGTSDVTAACDNVSRGMSGVSGSSRDAATSLDHLSSSTNNLSSQYGNLSEYATEAASALALFELAAQAKEATLLAARVETLGVVMQAVGNNAGYTRSEMEKFAEGVEKMGITSLEARNTVIKLAQAQLDLTKSAQLARVAQDAAVLGNVNSSEALGRIVEGIQTMQPRVLHTIGLMVDLQQSEKDYATAAGKTTADLTAREKQQIALNAVMEQGTRIEGSYEAAMGTAGKQINSMARLTEELKLAWGNVGLPTLTILVNNLTDALKALNSQAINNKDSFKTWGQQLSDLSSGTLNYFKKDLIQVSALIMDIKGGAYRLGSLGALPGAVAGSDLYDNMVKTANGYTAAANAQREYLAAMKASESVQTFTSPADLHKYDDSMSLEDKKIAAGNAARKLEAEKAAAAAAEKAAEEARQLAEKQAVYNKQLWDSEAALKEQYRQNEKRQEDDALKARLDQLSFEKDMGLKTIQEYLDAKYDQEKATYQKELIAAKEQAHQRYLEYSKVSDDPGADRMMQAKSEQEWAKSLGVVEQAQAKLNAVNAAKPHDDYKNDVDLLKQVFSAQKDLLSAQGDSYGAALKQIAIDETGLKYKNKETEAILREVDAINLAKLAYDKWISLKQQMTALDQQNSATAASMVGTNNSGGFDSIEAQTANKMAILTDAHNTRMEQIDAEQQANEKRMMDEKRTTEEVTAANIKYYEKAALEKQKFDKDSTKITEDGFKSQLAVVGNYAEMGSQLFAGLSSAQDQSTKAGFEAAKNYSLGAAVMSTAAAIIGQLTGPDAWTPIAWARSGLAAALGAIQIAKIESTSFGGGGSSSSSVPSGSFAGSGYSSSQVGGSIGAPITSVQDGQTQESLQKLAKSADNASLAISKVSDGLTKMSDLFTTGSNMTLATGSIAAQAANLTSSPGLHFLNGLLGDPVSTFITRSIFGGGWNTTGGGVQLGMQGGNVSAQGYTTYHKDGGWFSSDQNKTDYTAQPGFQSSVQSAVNSIIATIDKAAAVMGTSVDTSLVNIAPTNIATAGRSQADIQKDLEAWLTTVSNELAKNVTGLKDFAFYGENAFDALVRLSTALQSTNESLDLVGATLIDSTLQGANAAYKLQDLMGGADKFTKAVDGYFSSMFTQEQQDAMKAAQATKQVNTAFTELGITGLTTKGQFIALVNSLDLTTDQGAKTFAALMNISSAFGTMADAAIKASKDLLTTALDNSLSAANALKDIMGGNMSTLSPEALYNQSQAAFAAALANKTDPASAAALPDLAKSLLSASHAYNASGPGYTADYNNVVKALSDIAGMSGTPTLSAAEKQVQLLTDIKTALDNNNMSQLTMLAGQVAAQTALNNLMANFLNLSAPVAPGDAAMSDQQAGQYVLQMLVGNLPVDLRWDLNKSGAIDLADSLLALKGMRPAFANGTPYVPYDMTADIHQGEIVMDRSSADALRKYGIPSVGQSDNKDLIAEIRELRKEVAELKNNQKGQMSALTAVSQEGFSQVAGNTAEIKESSKTLARKTRLAATA